MHMSTDFGGFWLFLDSQQASALSNASQQGSSCATIYYIEYRWDAKSQGL